MRAGRAATGGRAAAAGGADYQPTPTLGGAERRGDGGVTLSGVFSPGARIRLSGADGQAFGATADAQGTWRIELPAASGPRLLKLTAEAGAGTVSGDGVVLVLPAPSFPAAVVRPGQGALAMGRVAGPPVIAALDYGATGAAAVSGLAPPGVAVRALIDETAVAMGRAAADGRFSLPLTGVTLKPGARVIRIETPAGFAAVSAQVIGAPTLKAPFRAEREAGDWRVVWALPGGGQQTTLVFDPTKGVSA